MRKHWYLLACSYLFIQGIAGFVSGCGGDDSASSPADLCEDVACSGHGACVATTDGNPLCLCDPGYHSEGTACQIDQPGEECSGVTCSGHGVCVVVQGDPNYPLCLCDEGYDNMGETNCVMNGGGGLECGPGTHEDDGRCLADELPPSSCEGVDCGANGVCEVNTFGRAYCRCGDGYRSENLSCVEDNCTGTMELLGEVDLPWVEGEYNGYQYSPRVFVRGDLAYVPVMHGLAVVDISDPTSPRVVSDTFSPWGRESHHLTLDAAMGGDYVYLSQSWDNPDPNQAHYCGVAVFDVSDPTAPAVVAQFDNTDAPGMQCFRLALVGDTLVSARGPYGVTSVDVTDPTQPTVKQVLNLDAGSLPSYSEMYPVGTDWLWMSTIIPSLGDPGQLFSAGPWGMVDVSSPEAMDAFGPMQNFVTYNGLGISSNLAAVGSEHGAFFLMDLSHPTTPVILGMTSLPVRFLYAARFFDHYAVVSTDGEPYVVDLGDPADPRIVASLDSSLGILVGSGLAVRDDGTIVGTSRVYNKLSVLRFHCE